MPASIFLAKLIGPILVVAALGLLANRKAFHALAQEILHSHALLYLFGLLDFAVGLAIVLTHNVWVGDWRVIITLLGWLMIVRGAVRVLIPDQVKTFGAKILKRNEVVAGSLAIVLVLGAVLCFFGYFR
jgi:hypothetical protein